MESGKEGQPLKEYGNRRKRYKRRKKIFITSVLLILVLSGAVYVYSFYNKTYTNHEVLSSTPNTEENIAEYLEYKHGMVRVSKDGAVAYDKHGKLLWNGSYEMLDPIADTCGDYVVVADRRGKAIQIFNEKGQAGTLNMDYEIAKVQIAQQGVTAVMMWNGETNFVMLFDRDGNVLVENKTVVQKDGYPMDIALSDDGRKLAVILLSVNRGKLSNSIAFYNYGEVGQNLTDRKAGEFGGFIYDEMEVLIPRIVFLNNNTVCAYKDNGFILYSIPERPVEVAQETFEEKIRSVLHNEKYMGLVLEGDSASKSRIILYDLKGEKLLDKNLEMDYNNIYISGDEIILYDDLNTMIMKINGRVKLKQTFQTNISAIFPINYLDRYFFVSGDEISEIKLLE